MANQDRTFALGGAITAPPGKSQGTAAASVPNERKRQRGKGEKANQLSEEIQLAPPSQLERAQPTEQQKNVGFLRRLFSRKGRKSSSSSPATSPPVSPKPDAAGHQAAFTFSAQETAAIPAQRRSDVTCPSPRLTNSLRPSTSASAVGLGGVVNGIRTTAEVTPGASTDPRMSAQNEQTPAGRTMLRPDDAAQMGMKSQQQQQDQGQQQRGMPRSRSEGTLLSDTGAQTGQKVGPHPVNLMVKAVKNVRAKNIDPATDLRQVVMQANGAEDFGMTLAGINPVLVMNIDKAGPAKEAGLQLNDMIVSVNGTRVSKCMPPEILTLIKKASHTVPHKRSHTQQPEHTRMMAVPPGGLALVSELKDNLRKSPRPGGSPVRQKNTLAKPEPLPKSPKSGKRMKKEEASSSPAQKEKTLAKHVPPSKSPRGEKEMKQQEEQVDEAILSAEEDEVDGDEPKGDEDVTRHLEEDVTRRLEEAANLILDVLDDNSENTERRKLSAGENPERHALVPPSEWDPSRGKPPGSAPSSPGTSRRETPRAMTFEEMADFSKSAPTTPGSARKSKLKRSSSKGSAFILEHKSGRMVSKAARKTIFGDEADEDERKKVQLMDDFETTPAETNELEAALGRATAKISSRGMSTDESAGVSPDIVVTPPLLLSPSSSVEPMSAVVAGQKDQKIASLQKALIASPGGLAAGYQKGAAQPRQTTMGAATSLGNVNEASSSTKAPIPKITKGNTQATSGERQRSKSVKGPSRRTSSSDFFDGALPTTAPSLGLHVGHSKRDIARGRSVRKPSRPKSTHIKPGESTTSSDLFVASTDADPVEAVDGAADAEPKRKQGVWDVTLTRTPETEKKATATTQGVNLVVQAHLKGSPSGSPSEIKRNRMSSAKIIAQASTRRKEGEASPQKSMKRRSRSVPAISDPSELSPPQSSEAGALATDAMSAVRSDGASAALPVARAEKGVVVQRRRAKTGRAERIKTNPDNETEDQDDATNSAPVAAQTAAAAATAAAPKVMGATGTSKPLASAAAAAAAAAAGAAASQAKGLKPAKAKKPSTGESTPGRKPATPDWVALAKAKQRME